MPPDRPPRESSGHRNERPAIAAVIRAATSGATLIGYPEEDASGPSVSRPCDALYYVGDERWAVEHTTVDIYRDERLARARFVPLAGPLERALTPVVDYLLIVSFPSEPLPHGLSWVRLAAAIEPAILDVLPGLTWHETVELSCLGVKQVETVVIRADVVPKGLKEPSSPVAQSVRSILWVDDNPKNNSYVIATLTDLGVTVTKALSTREALQLFGPDRFDRIVTDRGRPEGDRAGIDLVRRIRSQDTTIPIIIYCGSWAATNLKEEALEAGASGITSSATTLLRLLNV